MHTTKRSSVNVGGNVVLVIGPFCAAIQAKWIGRPLTWLGDLQQWWVAVNCWSLWSFCCFGVSELWAANFSPSQSHLFRTKGYRDAGTSEKLQHGNIALLPSQWLWHPLGGWTSGI